MAALSGCGGSDDQVTLNVYNWGMNIAEGEDGYINVVELFEEKYPYIDVNYTTYEDNESLYTRLKNGGRLHDSAHDTRGHAPPAQLRHHPELRAG